MKRRRGRKRETRAVQPPQREPVGRSEILKTEIFEPIWMGAASPVQDEERTDAAEAPTVRAEEQLASVRTVRRKDRERPAEPEPGIHPGNQVFVDVLGQEILLVVEANQLNILGQTFRPIFCGPVTEVTNGFITLDPVIIKMPNAPFHRNPFPLSFPLEKVDTFTPFDCSIRFPLV
ncbi:MAG: hypothetical protein ACOY94_27545 [Bacillota bacterium]